VPKPTGFQEYAREVPARRPVPERINDWFEIYQPFPEEKVRIQGARCMDCGVPFCHTGCPVNNLIPDWNDLVHSGRWKEALRILHATNNFPEFTGRICPAPCEAACVLGINDPPVSIKLIEKSIVDRGFEEGWIVPEPPRMRTGKRVAIVGSGPAGLAAAQQLCRAGHWVTVFEKSDRLGGLLRYGIPNFKMEKHLIDRRLAQLSAEGVEFLAGQQVGGNVGAKDLVRDFDAVLIAVGAEAPRISTVPGSDLGGVHYAMEYLTQQNRVCEKDTVPNQITAQGKRVAIIGGGDTGADCLGTAHRQHAISIHQLEYKDAPPNERDPSTPWPLWPKQLRTESSHEEGGYREWAAMTLAFAGDAAGQVKQLHGIRVGPKPEQRHIEGTEFTLDVDLVLIAAGFTGPVRAGVLDELGVRLDRRGNVTADEHQMTSVPGVFTAGDARRGQSLVVWAIAEGRKAAEGINRYLDR
jgi:glutamate synthase (NADPH/NADH) small chain